MDDAARHARPAGVSNSELRARSADYFDFAGPRGRRPQIALDSGERPAGLLRRRSPPLDVGATSDDEAPSPSKRETQLSPHMRSGEDARNALLQPCSSVKRSVSLPDRCFYEPCKPMVTHGEISTLPTNPDWLKTRVAALREENEVPVKVRIRLEKVRRDKADRAIAEIPSVLKGYGERMTYRSPSPRLRGEAAIAIGEASKASHGVPWRSLPGYSKGALCQTMVGSVAPTKRARTLAEYSEKLGDSTMKELLYPQAKPVPAKKDHQFEAWLMSVQTCLKSISSPQSPTPQSPPASPASPSSRRAGSPTLTEKQQMCKPLKKYLESDLSTQDACPFARNDSDSAARETLAPTVKVRVRVPPPCTRRAPEIAAADLVQEKNRRWQFLQDMAEIKNGLSSCSYRSPRRSLGSPRLAHREENPLLKIRECSSASQSTLEPDQSQSVRTPLSPMSPLVTSTYYQEALRPRWR